MTVHLTIALPAEFTEGEATSTIRAALRQAAQLELEGPTAIVVPVGLEPLDVARLERALRTIHGGVVPLPNRPSTAQYAEMIARWYVDPDQPDVEGQL